MSTERINKILTMVAILVGSIFALKNLISKNFGDAIFYTQKKLRLLCNLLCAL